MSWMQILCDIYDQQAAIGMVSKAVEDQPMLLPLYHVEMQAQIEITIDEKSNFLSARVIQNKKDRLTVIPCTEKSASRTSGVEAMPLFDKLIYIAGDYAQYSPVEPKHGQDAYNAYEHSLAQWCEFEDGHPDSRAWLAYIRKKNVIGDLVACGLLRLNEEGKVPEKWSGEGKPEIYSAIPTAPLDAFVRFRVARREGESRVWMNPEVQNAFVNYQNHIEGRMGLCCATGKALSLATSHPKYIRYGGDGAKLISSNDKSGFTFRGRFDTAEEAVTIGRETTEKAHAALKWLIQRQGFRNDDQVIVSYTSAGEKTPPLMEDISNWDQPIVFQKEIDNTAGEIDAVRLRNALAGYSGKKMPDSRSVIMGLDSATPGRLSIFYYRELRTEELITRVVDWHTKCAWRHTYHYVEDGLDEDGKKVFRSAPFVGAPAPVDIVKAAYGENVSSKLLKSAVERLLPCIADGARLPVDIMKNAACNAEKAAQHTPTEQRKALSIACSLIRKHENEGKDKEEWNMALNRGCTDRSYLFGRALAYAEQIEWYAQRNMDEKRATNAERMMVAFAKHPARVWKQLMERLRPYQDRLGEKGKWLNDGMAQVMSQMIFDDFSNAPLNERYLLGYACQKQAFWEKSPTAQTEKNSENANSTKED
ncbi:MAG: type I-C CRISPR-associated protein Cas8c/Csd1 [Eubacteriales bacterium]|nr:type I-C CRISPR-associated protein Cas8c/Csd1 [Eubacteriales bacterium]